MAETTGIFPCPERELVLRGSLPGESHVEVLVRRLVHGPAVRIRRVDEVERIGVLESPRRMLPDTPVPVRAEEPQLALLDRTAERRVEVPVPGKRRGLGRIGDVAG